MLQSRVVHPKKQAWDKGYHNDNHHALEVVAVAYMRSFSCNSSGNQQKRFKGIESGMQERQPAAFAEGGLNLFYDLFNPLHCISFIIRSIPF